LPCFALGEKGVFHDPTTREKGVKTPKAIAVGMKINLNNFKGNGILSLQY
jgi:hypothetical protein